MKKPYSELTQRGKLRRLRKVTLAALEHYDLVVSSVKYLTTDTNTMFMVHIADGRRYVLRIYSEEETSLRENRAEMFWLRRIVQDTNLRVTVPVARRDGAYVTTVSVEGVPGERRCALFEWVPGRTMSHYLNADTHYEMGRSLAALHNHAESLNPLSPDIRPKKWDKVFYYPDEPVVYNTPLYAHLFSAACVAILDAVIVRADALFSRLFTHEDEQILIHGDLHYWNVHVSRGQLYLIDFEDIMLGYPVQDVAVTLMYGRDKDGYDEWRAAFEAGYAGVRPWPVEDERQLQTLMAARTVMFINYVARIDPSPEAYIARRCGDLQRFLAEYG